MQEFIRVLPGSKKTFSRDIAILKKTGYPVRYSVSRQAFVLEDDTWVSPCPSDNKAEQIFLKKIIRLTIMLNEIPDVDCDKWYAETFPQSSKRTMQRDFAILNAIGYKIKYERELFNSHNAGFDVPPRHYYCDRPYDAYGLTIFRKDGF